MHSIFKDRFVAAFNLGYYTATTIELDGLADNFSVVLRRPLHTQEIRHFLDFTALHQRTLDTLRLWHISSHVQHVTHAEQFFGTNLIDNRPGIDLTSGGKGDSSRHISFNQPS